MSIEKRPALKLTKKNWHARLELAYKKSNSKTIVSHRLHKGPLVIQKPFYPENEVCHSYLIHPPGGIVGGDVLELDVELNPESHALITTPAANKFYRSKQDVAYLHQEFRIKEKALLEWLPQESIFFNNCNVKIINEFHLDEHANLICWEINCFGRPAGNEFFNQGKVEQKIIISRAGILEYIDRSIVDDKSNILNSPWGLNSFPVMATMIVSLSSVSTSIILEKLELIQEHTEKRIISFTKKNNIIIIRVFAFQTREVLSIFTQCWEVVRPLITGKKICPPRIWAT